MQFRKVLADITKGISDMGKKLPHMGNVPREDNEASRDIEKSLAHVNDVLLHVNGVPMHVDPGIRVLGENPFEFLFFLPDMREETNDVVFPPPDMHEENNDVVYFLQEVHPQAIVHTFSAFVLQQGAFVLKQGSFELKQRAFVHDPASVFDTDDPVQPAEIAGRNDMARFIRQFRCAHVTNRPSHAMRRSRKTL